MKVALKRLFFFFGRPFYGSENPRMEENKKSKKINRKSKLIETEKTEPLVANGRLNVSNGFVEESFQIEHFWTKLNI